MLGMFAPFVILDSVRSEFHPFAYIATLVFVAGPIALIPACLGIVLFQVAREKFPDQPNPAWERLKKTMGRAKDSLLGVFGFLLVAAFAVAVLHAVGFWGLFSNPGGVDDWPWYNFLGLALGVIFAGWLIFVGLKHLGEDD